jgi:hypothetical protein
MDYVSKMNNSNMEAAPDNVRPAYNPVEQAHWDIAAYSNHVGRAFDDATPLLVRALAATYAAVIELGQNEQARVAFLGEQKRSGRISRNPILPIVRKLWHAVLTRERVHTYASCLGLALQQNVPPEGFMEWIGKFEGGINGAAKLYSASAKSADEKAKARDERKFQRDELLSKQDAIPMPRMVGGRQAGLYLAAIRINTEGISELVGFLDNINRKPKDVDAIIVRGLR